MFYFPLFNYYSPLSLLNWQWDLVIFFCTVLINPIQNETTTALRMCTSGSPPLPHKIRPWLGWWWSFIFGCLRQNRYTVIVDQSAADNSAPCFRYYKYFFQKLKKKLKISHIKFYNYFYLFTGNFLCIKITNIDFSTTQIMHSFSLCSCINCNNYNHIS